MKEYHIPIFVTHRGCPFQCVFCDQERITGNHKNVTAEDVRNSINKYLGTFKDTSRFTEAAFFGGSFTGIQDEQQEELLGAAYQYVKDGKINGIRISTRPDYISQEIVERLLKYGVTTVELGVQSMDETVLKASGRGHSAAQVDNAVGLLAKTNIRIGLQMMTGLPGDTADKAIKTAQRLIALQPEMVRIYPTLVIKGTPLHKMYLRGDYIPQALDEAVELSKVLLTMFEDANIEVIRIGLQPTDEISEDGEVAAGPYHPAFRELVEGKRFLDKLLNMNICGETVIRVNPSDVSKVIGQKKCNLETLNRHGIRLKIIQDNNIEKGRIIPVNGVK